MKDHEAWNNIWLAYEGYNRKKLLKVYKKLAIDSLDRKIAVLDIGCGTGAFLKILRQKGFNNLHGWEPQIELVNQKVDDAVVVGNCLESIENKEYFSRFDVVFIIGVLHHLRSSDEIRMCMRNVHLLLKNDGILISVEPRNTIIRTIMTYLMMKLPNWILPPNVALDKILVEHEYNELVQWLHNQVKYDQMILQDGLFVSHLAQYDWRYRYLTFQKLSRNAK